jgi:hypothetical protein
MTSAFDNHIMRVRAMINYDVDTQSIYEAIVKDDESFTPADLWLVLAAAKMLNADEEA